MMVPWRGQNHKDENERAGNKLDLNYEKRENKGAGDKFNPTK